MEKLSENWLTQGLIDYEYKKYILLAYLKTVGESFGRVELYPFLADLVFHYRNLLMVKENKDVLFESFPKEISKEEFNKLQLSYKKIVEDDVTMQEIESIIDFAIPQIKHSLDEGSQLFEIVEANCEISPIGVTPLYAAEGYLFVTQPPAKETRLYRYQVSIFENASETHRGLNLRLLDTFRKGLAQSYEHIKLDLIRRFNDLPNPATFLAVSKLRFPYEPTLMPVVKRLLVKQISST
ncbi:MAG TPA: hypothetical protein PKC24_07080 [Cyclobacteriaceae bacterium]|nr:hypothetical protein [Cyclobacteriaceae bacterium]